MGANWLARYNEGARCEVWREMVDLGAAIREPRYLPAAEAVARETMRRARHNVELLLTRLDRFGYCFWSAEDSLREQQLEMEQCLRLAEELRALHRGGEGGPLTRLREQPALNGRIPVTKKGTGGPLENPEVWTRPNRETAQVLDRFEGTIGGPLPLSLRIWCEEVGAVSLMGRHPVVCHRAGSGAIEISDAVLTRTGARFVNRNGGARRDPPLSDPLVVTPYFGEWEEMAEVCMDAEDDGEPERLEEMSLAPDRYHKANYSGGEPYGMRVPDAAVDGVFTDANGLLFVDYLRLAFRWGGFPGWANYPDRPQLELNYLAEDLLPI
jgi:hypothetical protein